VVGAGADRPDDLLGFGRGEDELDVFGWLLDDLQQGVEALLGHHVRLVDDVDLVAAGHRREVDALTQIAGIVHPAVGSGVDLDDVDAARASGGQLHAGIADSAGRGGGALRTVQAAGQDPRAGGLAAAARPAEQVRVVDLVVGDRPAQRLGNVFLADDLGEGVRTIAPVQRQRRRRTLDGRSRRYNDGLGR
jgi:hypothetical protein